MQSKTSSQLYQFLPWLPFRKLYHFLHRLRIMIGWIFDQYGRIVGQYPYPFLITPLVITFLMASGVVFVKVEDDLRFLYSPENAPSRKEYEVHKRFTGEGSQSTYCSLALEAVENTSLNDSKNLLETKQQTNSIYEINDYVMRNLSFKLGNVIYHFGTDVCPRIAFCPDSNRIVEKFLDTYWSDELQEDPRVSLTYPVMEFFDNKFFLPAHLYGVKTDRDTRKVVAVGMVHLMYQIPGTENDTADSVAGAFEQSLMSYLERVPPPGLTISMFSLRILRREVNKNTTYTFPFVSITVCLLVTFTIFSCLTSDPLTSKPIEGLFGIFSSSLAIISSAGFMCWCGVPYISQVAVMPFIALAIGVDDTYIILGAWQQTDRTKPTHRRLGQALWEAGSAITVTSLTDCLSFGIGAFSPTPAISIFCKYIAAAIMFDYFYQLTFFVAIVTLGGRREAKGYHSYFIWRKVDKSVVDRIKTQQYVCPMDRVFNRYAKFLCKAPVRISVLLIYCGYVILALYGCAKLRPTLIPSTLVVDDSPLRHYIDLAEGHIWSEGLMGRVYINKAPNFSLNKSEVQRFLKFVNELEKTPYSMGEESTQLWLKEFLNYWQYFAVKQKNFYIDLQGYLDVSFNNQWAPYLRWSRHTKRRKQRIVNRFYFTTGFQIKNWNERTAMQVEWRRICAKYPEYEAFVYDEQNFYGDQILALPSTTLSLLGIAILVMSTICIIFIADPCIVFWVIFTLLSMDIGIAGFLSLWGADLSPTTVVNILMSIGLSVDFSTHVGYRIYRTHCENPDQWIEDALSAIAWPVMQGGISTFLAIISMILVKSHVVRMFARTCTLVVVFGLFHGLVLLPVILRTFRTKRIKKCSNKTTVYTVPKSGVVYPM